MWTIIISGIMSLSILPAGADRSVPVYDINEKAILHFRQSFTQASAERWTIGSEGYRVSFFIGSVKHVADYYLNGRWRNTIRVYNEAHLPDNIRRNLKTSFGNSEILQATELQLGNEVAYFVKIRQNEWSKTIQLVGHNVAVVEEFREK